MTAALMPDPHLSVLLRRGAALVDKAVLSQSHSSPSQDTL